MSLLGGWCQEAPDQESVTCEGLDSTNLVPSPSFHAALLFVSGDAAVATAGPQLYRLPPAGCWGLGSFGVG